MFALHSTLCVCLTGFSGGHFRPTPRAAFVSAFHGLERGHVVQFKGLELGQAPKHLMEKQRLLLTPQILNILQEVDEYFERVHAILFGPEEPLSPSSPAVGPASSCPPIPAGSSAASMDGVNALTGMMASTSIEQDAGTAPCASSIDAVMAATPNPWAGLLPAAAIFSMDLVCRAGNRGGGLPMVLAGPMGVGKSFTAWAVAASSYAQGRRVLYIGDANVWMDVDAAQQVRFLINSFVSLNRDILSLEERSRLERPTASWSDLKHILYDAAHPTVVVIDEHAPVVVKYEAAEKDGSLMLKHNWMLSFVKLHIWEGAHNTVVIFCGSSHASFELNHLKNGMQQYLRFMVPLEKDHELPEAKTLMLLEGVPSALLDDAMALDQLMTVTNGVPREISHFARFLRFTSIRLPNQTSVSAAVSASSSMVHSSGPWPHAATAATAGASSMHIAAATSSASESSSGVSRPDTRSHRAKKPSNVTHAQSPAMSSSLQPLSSSSKSGASHVVSIHELLDKFVEWRRKQIEYEASKYFDRLTPSQCSFYMNSLAALFSRSSAPNGPGDVSGFIDLGLCYRTWTPDGEVVRPLCLAATRALLALYHEKAPQHSQLAMRIHSMRGVKGDDFEDLVWHLLTRDGVLDERSVPCCYLNGESAGDLLLNWDDFYVLPHGQSPPLSFQDRSMLYRLPPGAPRWDFAAPNMLLQVSRSNFGVHNKESADISLSFVVDQPDGSCEISRMLNSLHKGTHVAEHSPVDHHFIFRRDGSVIPFHLVYVTLERPNHPGLFKRFPDLRIISALDVWSVASAGQTVSSGFTARG